MTAPRAVVLTAALALSVVGKASAKPPFSAPPLPPLPMLPSVAKVRVQAHAGLVSVTEEVSLPRGDWKGTALQFHLAFGVPAPRAIDAHLVPIEDGALEADEAAVGEPLPLERVARRPPTAYPLLGRPLMAGMVVRLAPEALSKALAPGNMAALRIRTVFDATADASGSVGFIVRLGESRGVPLTLGRVTASSAQGVRALERAEAHLCGPEADPHPLAIGLVPKPTGEAPIAPVLAVRHASDDLCVKLWL